MEDKRAHERITSLGRAERSDLYNCYGMVKMELTQIVLSIAGAMCIFVLTAVWSRLGKLEESDEKLTREIAQIHVLVAGEYIKRIEITPHFEKLHDELKNIRSDLGRKVERREDA